MKILLLGDISGKIDEGMKNISFHYKAGLSKNHEVLTLRPRECIKLISLLKIKKFVPDIIHYIHGPSIRSLFITKFFELISPKAKTFISATNPRIGGKWFPILPFLKPSTILTQSKIVDNTFRKLGFTTVFFPNGVDIDTFKPIDEELKKHLKKKYDISINKFIILHVGHIKDNRNLEIFSEIQNKIKDVQVIIVGSTRFRKEVDIERRLVDSGCLVWRDYFEAINEIYCLSDCYVFPVNTLFNINPLNNLTGCIEIPLSVLEAMACNLPIITTKYGGLPDLFTEDNAFYFYEKDQELFEIIKVLMEGVGVNNRTKILRYSWDCMIEGLETIYRSGLQNADVLS